MIKMFLHAAVQRIISMKGNFEYSSSMTNRQLSKGKGSPEIDCNCTEFVKYDALENEADEDIENTFRIDWPSCVITQVVPFQVDQFTKMLWQWIIDDILPLVESLLWVLN